MRQSVNSPRNLQAQLKTAQADTRPKFLIELAKPTQKKYEVFTNTNEKYKTVSKKCF
jgi:hypothetical protein